MVMDEFEFSVKKLNQKILFKKNSKSDDDEVEEKSGISYFPVKDQRVRLKEKRAINVVCGSSVCMKATHVQIQEIHRTRHRAQLLDEGMFPSS